MKLLKILFVSAFIGLMSGGCILLPQPEVPAEPTVQSPSPTATMPVLPQAVTAARARLAEQLQIPAEQVMVINFEAKDWPDGCLGAANPGEMCNEVITPGYRVVLEANVMQYTFRTNNDGSVIRPEPMSTVTPGADLPIAVQNTRQALAKTLGITPDAIHVVSFTAVDWPDGCLGAANPGEMCLEVITPGYKVVLEAYAMQYTFRTNEDGSIIRSEPKPAIKPGMDLPIAVQNARQALAKKLGIAPDAIQVVSFEAVNWPTGCLGVMQKGVMCTDLVTPGYRVILATADNAQYEYHTDQTGQSVVLAKSPTS